MVSSLETGARQNVTAGAASACGYSCAMPLSRVLGFLTAVLMLTAGLHYYLWTRLVRGTELPRRWRRILTTSLILLAVSLPASMFIGRFLKIRPSAIAWPAFLWLGLLYFFFCTLVVTDVVWLLLAARRRLASEVPTPERRLFLRRLLAGTAATVSAGLGAFAVRNAVTQPPLKDVTLTLSRLPAAHDGLVVVQMTDVHVGPTIGRDFIEGLVARTNALNPDIVVITGDLVDGSVAQLRHATAPLGNLKARHGVFFVTGNHEYYSGADDWLAELRRLGIRPLRNERVTIGADDTGFDLAGVDDHSARGQAPGHGSDLPAALAGRDPSRFVLLLAHQPRTVTEAAEHGVDVQLSGHTHGGQLWPWGFLVKLQQGFERGLATVGPTTLYVSCGTGYWGPPMRLGAPAELTRLTLRRAIV